MSTGAALIFLEGFQGSFADRQLSEALAQEDFSATRQRLARLAVLDGQLPGNLSAGGVFAALYAADILKAFDCHVAAEPIEL